MSSLIVDSPIPLFERWLEDAKRTDLAEPTAMSVATVDAEGMPNVRMLLLKGVDERGFVFYTNLGSRKARELESNAKAALCFHWMPLERQVRVRGVVEKVSEEEADAYFASRARQSRIGAYASKQSQPLSSMLELEKRVAKVVARYPMGEIPRPSFWSGFRVIPDEIEFWMAKPFRLHERVIYTRDGGAWTTLRVFP